MEYQEQIHQVWVYTLAMGSRFLLYFHLLLINILAINPVIKLKFFLKHQPMEYVQARLNFIDSVSVQVHLAATLS